VRRRPSGRRPGSSRRAARGRMSSSSPSTARADHLGVYATLVPRAHGSIASRATECGSRTRSRTRR
jgi:hypothetical protein